jgi:heptosyltransferase-1
MGPPDYRIASRVAPASGAPRCLLLHGTTWASKHWPERFWCDIAQRAAAAGFEVRLPWGDAVEQARAERIASVTDARVLPRQPIGPLMDELAAASLVIGVDSGLSHLAAALEVPTLVLYGSTSSELTGCRGARVRNLQADFPCSPCLTRECRYRGPEQRWSGMPVTPACYAMLPPDLVWAAATETGRADRLLHF